MLIERLIKFHSCDLIFDPVIIKSSSTYIQRQRSHSLCSRMTNVPTNDKLKASQWASFVWWSLIQLQTQFSWAPAWSNNDFRLNSLCLQRRFVLKRGRNMAQICNNQFNHVKWNYMARSSAILLSLLPSRLIVRVDLVPVMVEWVEVKGSLSLVHWIWVLRRKQFVTYGNLTSINHHENQSENEKHAGRDISSEI